MLPGTPWTSIKSDRMGAALQLAGFLARQHAIDAGIDDLAAVPRRRGPLDGPPGHCHGLPGASLGGRTCVVPRDLPHGACPAAHHTGSRYPGMEGFADSTTIPASVAVSR